MIIIMIIIIIITQPRMEVAPWCFKWIELDGWDGSHWPGSRPKTAEIDRRWTQWFWAVLGEYIHPKIVEKL